MLNPFVLVGLVIHRIRYLDFLCDKINNRPKNTLNDGFNIFIYCDLNFFIFFFSHNVHFTYFL